jgi:hypothetical protein
VRPLVREDRDVVRVVIVSVSVTVVDHLTWLQRPTKLPFCYRSMLVVGLLGAGVPPTDVRVSQHA